MRASMTTDLAAGYEKNCKANGTLRQESKNYVVKDIMHPGE